VGKALTHRLPPRHAAVYQIVPGHLRGDALHAELRQRGEQEAPRGHGRLRGKVVSGGGHRPTTLAATGNRTARARGLGIAGDTSHVRGASGGLMDLGHLGEDRLGVGHLFCG
jgi:hypothetical protein